MSKLNDLTAATIKLIDEQKRFSDWHYHPMLMFSRKGVCMIPGEEGCFLEDENKAYHDVLHQKSDDTGVSVFDLFEQEEDENQMELKDTIDLMVSADYKDRLKGEYYQTKIRYNGLHKMIVKYEAGKLDFTPDCPLELLQEQASCMGNYLHKLEIRAEIEDIKL